MRLRKVVLEVEDVPEIGAAPLVDRLVRIADDAEVAMLAGQPLDQQVLRPVRVLVLVDHQVPELVAVALADRRRLLEQLDRLEQQVVEVERVRILQRLHVQLVQLADLLVARIPGVVANDLRPFHPVLRMADARQRQPRLHGAVVHPDLPQRLLHHRRAGRSSRR